MHNEIEVFLEGVEYEPSISIRICGLFLFLVIEKEKILLSLYSGNVTAMTKASSFRSRSVIYYVAPRSM